MTTFRYWGDALDLFDHPYNTTIRNERAVEVPIALAFIAQQSGPGMELGNVLNHYGCEISRRVVDRYEKAAGVSNFDVFDILGQFPWIVSVSTIEHVGWDDGESDPLAAPLAIAHLRSLLAEDGRMLLTVPLGYHPPLDDHLIDELDTVRACTLVRHGNGWRQTKTPTRKPYIGNGQGAGAVWIGELGRPR